MNQRATCSLGGFNEFGILPCSNMNIIVTGIFFFMCKLDLLTVMQCQTSFHSSYDKRRNKFMNNEFF